jgi:hypothetical protein
VVEVENLRPPIGSARRRRKDDILGVDVGLTVREGGVDLVEIFWGWSGMCWRCKKMRRKVVDEIELVASR